MEQKVQVCYETHIDKGTLTFMGEKANDKPLAFLKTIHKEYKEHYHSMPTGAFLKVSIK